MRFWDGPVLPLSLQRACQTRFDHPSHPPLGANRCRSLRIAAIWRAAGAIVHLRRGGQGANWSLPPCGGRKRKHADTREDAFRRTYDALNMCDGLIYTHRHCVWCRPRFTKTSL